VVHVPGQVLSGGRRGRRWRSRPGPAARVGVAQAQEGDAPGLVAQRGDPADDGNRGRCAVEPDGGGDAARRDGGQHGDRERREALRRYLVGQQQLARELAKRNQRNQADGRKQADHSGPRAYSHFFSIGGVPVEGNQSRGTGEEVPMVTSSPDGHVVPVTAGTTRPLARAWRYAPTGGVLVKAMPVGSSPSPELAAPP